MQYFIFNHSIYYNCFLKQLLENNLKLHNFNYVLFSFIIFHNKIKYKKSFYLNNFFLILLDNQI